MTGTLSSSAVSSNGQSEGRRTRLIEQRKQLPDGPGVYVFRDQKGKRVASHFSNPVTRGAYEMVDAIDSVEFLLVSSETEALLTEQGFIKQYRPRFNIRLRDDKSYPYIAISMDEDYPRVYFTRERHRRGRMYFGPYSNAKRVRSTLDTLGKVFLIRSCTFAQDRLIRLDHALRIPQITLCFGSPVHMLRQRQDAFRWAAKVFEAFRHFIGDHVLYEDPRFAGLVSGVPGLEGGHFGVS